MLKARWSLFGGSFWLTLLIQFHPHFLAGDITPTGDGNQQREAKPHHNI